MCMHVHVICFILKCFPLRYGPVTVIGVVGVILFNSHCYPDYQLKYWRKSYCMSYPPFLKFVVTSVFLHVVSMVHFFVPSVISLCGVVRVVHWTLIKWQNILFWNKLWHNYPFFTFFATLCFIGCRLRKFHDIIKCDTVYPVSGL